MSTLPPLPTLIPPDSRSLIGRTVLAVDKTLSCSFIFFNDGTYTANVAVLAYDDSEPFGMLSHFPNLDAGDVAAAMCRVGLMSTRDVVAHRAAQLAADAAEDERRDREKLAQLLAKYGPPGAEREQS